MDRGRPWLCAFLVVTTGAGPLGVDAAAGPKSNLGSAPPITRSIATTMAGPGACIREYTDFGDAPEGIPAYPSGVIGRFPSCTAITPPGTQEAGCAPLGTAPGATGHVVHVKLDTTWASTWLGCGTSTGSQGIDGEPDAKFNLSSTAGDPSACAAATTDCVETAFAPAMYFGQDECEGDSVDAAGGWFHGEFVACSTAYITVRPRACTGPMFECFLILNVLVDWNMDGDWNDSFVCPSTGRCVQEWAIKNLLHQHANCDCATLTTAFSTGPRLGKAWMRVTLTYEEVPADFPWNGSLGMPNGCFASGETEDHVVEIVDVLTDVADRRTPRVEMGTPRPNPSLGRLMVPFTLERPTRVSLAAYDASGRRVGVLAAGELPAGPHEIQWDFRNARGENLPVGLYWIRLEADGAAETRRVSRVE